MLASDLAWCPALATHCNDQRQDHLFISFWLCWVFIAACRLSLTSASRGSSLVVVPRLLIVVASPVAEHHL